jgi:hypothetical protein
MLKLLFCVALLAGLCAGNAVTPCYGGIKNDTDQTLGSMNMMNLPNEFAFSFPITANEPIIQLCAALQVGSVQPVTIKFYTEGQCGAGLGAYSCPGTLIDTVTHTVDPAYNTGPNGRQWTSVNLTASNLAPNNATIFVSLQATDVRLGYSAGVGTSYYTNSPTWDVFDIQYVYLRLVQASTCITPFACGGTGTTCGIFDNGCATHVTCRNCTSGTTCLHPAYNPQGTESHCYVTGEDCPVAERIDLSTWSQQPFVRNVPSGGFFWYTSTDYCNDSAVYMPTTPSKGYFFDLAGDGRAYLARVSPSPSARLALAMGCGGAVECNMSSQISITFQSKPGVHLYIHSTNGATSYQVIMSTLCGDGNIDLQEECDSGENCTDKCTCAAPAFKCPTAMPDCCRDCTDVRCLSCDIYQGHCLQCTPGNELAGDGCYACGPNSYSNGTLPCAACTNCLTCNTGNGDCTKCPNGQEPSGTDCVDCRSSQWSFGTSCFNCIAGCSMCNTTDKCLQCTPGYGLTAAGTCQQCNAGSTWSDGTMSCQPCAGIPMCTSCEVTNGICSRCQAGYGFYNTTLGCIPCQAGTYNAQGTECQDCMLGFGCLTCNPADGQCTLCPTGNEILGDRCRYCRDNYYSNDGISCHQCVMGGGCQECDVDTGDCIACPQKYGLSGTGCSLCATNAYSDGTEPCYNCELNNGCKQCSNVNGVCLSCPAGSGVSGDGCVGCAIGWYSTGQAVCQECAFEDPCKGCDSKTGHCNKCPSTHELNTTTHLCQLLTVDAASSFVPSALVAFVALLVAYLF